MEWGIAGRELTDESYSVEKLRNQNQLKTLYFRDTADFGFYFFLLQI